MKNEHEFNSYLAKEFRKLTPDLKCLKASDKFSIGVSDFLLWYRSKSVAMECKFIKAFPKKPTTDVLSHKFEGPQYSFLQQISMTGSHSYGLVGVASEKKMYLIPIYSLHKDGNYTLAEFMHQNFKAFAFDDVDGLIKRLFLEY